MAKKQRIEYIAIGVDVYLQKVCNSAFDEFCPDGPSLNCLRKNYDVNKIDLRCRKAVLKRLIDRNKNLQMDQNLWKACYEDISNKCQSTILIESNSKEGNKVIKCLRNNLVRKNLQPHCRLQVSSFIKASAFLDYRLNPTLNKNCKGQIESLCDKFPNDMKEECLKIKFSKNLIERNSTCYEVIKIGYQILKFGPFING